MKISGIIDLGKDELTYLLKLNKTGRRLHVYNVGFMKTGTESISGIFIRFRSAHEFLYDDNTVSTIMRYETGKISKVEFRNYVRYRDNFLMEVDSSTCNHFFIDILMKEFPSVKFILTVVRDCFLWIDSILDMLYETTILPGVCARRSPYYRFLYGLDIYSGMKKKDFVEESRRNIGSLISFWNENNSKCIDRIPVERLLVLKTEDISDSADRIAGFLNLDISTLNLEKTHLNRRVTRAGILSEVGAEEVKEKIEQSCIWPDLEELFKTAEKT